MKSPPKKLLAGFDGFIDSIVRPLRRVSTKAEAADYYPDIASLGTFLQSQAGKSCSIELDVQAQKMGGNAPLLAGGAVALGMDVTCIGMLGQGQTDPVFSKSLNARLFSYAAPGFSTALEFGDGKVFLAPGVHLPAPAWQLIEEATAGKAAALLQEADCLAIVNWSELSFAGALWQDIFENALEAAPADKSRAVLFDLCDCARKSADEIGAVLRLIGRYGRRRHSVLSLNENEATILATQALPQAPASQGEAAEALRRQYGIDAVLVHTRGALFYATVRGLFTLRGGIIEKPLLSTGAGDHLNAAMCYTLAHHMQEDDALHFADRFSRLYLTTGRAPGLDEMEAEPIPQA